MSVIAPLPKGIFGVKGCARGYGRLPEIGHCDNGCRSLTMASKQPSPKGVFPGMDRSSLKKGCPKSGSAWAFSGLQTIRLEKQKIPGPIAPMKRRKKRITT
jgi:hypothetical protein